jgi:hypothetical protein
MATWKEFAAVSPDLANFITSRLSGLVAYLATIQSDGSPRVHPVVVHFSESELFVYMNPASPKARDLQRDSRYALHCGVEDTDGGNGEASISGRSWIIADPVKRLKLFDLARAHGFHPDDGYVLFALTIERVVTTTYEDGQVKRRTWTGENSLSSAG